MLLEEKIIKKSAKIGVIGLGYVGLPLAVEFAKCGFEVLGIDNDEKKIEKIKKGIPYISDLNKDEVRTLVERKKLKATNDYKVLGELEVICICVPTPLSKTKEPDLSYIYSATDKIREYLRKGQLIILESTTYPGTTEEVVLPRLENKNLRVGRDFYLAFSPERVDPGNKEYTTKNTPRVVSGVTKECSRLVKLLYEQIVEEVIVVSSCRVAEMSKLLENIYRSVNIALVNEMALLCDKMKINVWEVIESASTKPFGFKTFYPGPGLGGHCIPIDPFYLSWKAKQYGFYTKFIELSGEINESMPEYVVFKVREALNSQGKSLKGSEVLILGVAYKRDVDDSRESPALKILELLENDGAKVSFNDPYIQKIKVNGKALHSMNLSKELLKKIDCLVIVTDHSSYDWSYLVQNGAVIVDTRNALKDFKGPNIVRL